MIFQIINLVFNILYVLILGRIIVSWVRVDPYHPTWGPIVRFLFEATEPFLAPIRRLLPPMGGLDLSPLVLLFAASFLRQIIFAALV